MGVCTPEKYIVSYNDDVSNVELRDHYGLDTYFNDNHYPFIWGDSFLYFIMHYPLDISKYLDVSISEGLCIYRNKSEIFSFNDLNYHDQAIISINISLWILIFITVLIGMKKFFKNFRKMT